MSLQNALGVSPLIPSLGGTGTATVFTAGSLVFADSSGIYTQNNANLFWDNSNARLAIGGAIVPNNTFTVQGDSYLNGNTSIIGVLATTGAVHFANFTTGIAHFGPTGVLSSSAVNLASSDVIGILPIANGGTGISTAFTQGSVIFAGSGGTYSQNNANFFWDNSNVALGIGGFPFPGQKLYVAGTAQITGDLTVNTNLSVSGSLVQFSSFASSVLTTNGSGLLQATSVLPTTQGGTGQSTYTDGQLLIGTTAGSTLTKAALTAGTGITITNGSGSITIAQSAGSNVTSITGTANQVLANGTSGSAQTGAITLTLPQSIGTSSDVTFAHVTASTTGGNFAALVNSSSTSATNTQSVGNYIRNSDATTNNWMTYAFLNPAGNIVSLLGCQMTNQTAATQSDLVMFAKSLAGSVVEGLRLVGSSNTITLANALPVASGGTGQTSYTNGQLLIGNTTGNTLTKATLTGTSNQVIVTNGGGSITLSLPQSIATTSSVTFGSVTASSTSSLFQSSSNNSSTSATTNATTNPNYSSINVNNTNNNWQTITFADSSAQLSGILGYQVTNHATSAGDFVFFTGTLSSPVERMRIASTGTITLQTALGVTSGGTGLSSLSQGDTLYASASNTLSALAKNSSSTRYLSNTGTSNNPAWAQIDLTNGITASGAISITPSGSNTLTLNNNVLKPGTTVFVYTLQTASSNDKTGNGDGYNIVYDTSKSNITSSFDGTTFTAPQTGLYLFVQATQINNIGAGHTDGNMRFNINTGTNLYIYNAGTPSAAKNASNQLFWNGSAAIRLTAGDTVTNQIVLFNSTKTVGVGTTSSANYTTYIGAVFLG